MKLYGVVGEFFNLNSTIL